MRLAAATCALLISGLWPDAWAQASTPDGEPEKAPRELGLVERSGTRLAQIDITVSGPPEIAANLKPADFRIRVQFTRVRDFTLDRYCSAPGRPAETAGEITDETAVAEPRLRSTFLFYADQIFLTLEGRQNAISLMRQLIRRLIHDGNRAMLVSNARELLVLQPLTDDPDLLLDAVDRLEKDRTQWHEFASQEDARVTRLVTAINDDRELSSRSFALERAMNLARRYQVEETWRAEKSMRRLTITLLRLTDEPSPKAAFFFSDTLRQNPGMHYASFFGEGMRESRAPLAMIESDAWAARSPFDKIVNEASAQGIRVYPVLSQGLVSTTSGALPSARAQNMMRANHSGSRARFYQARDSLANLATETGGYAFLNGQSASRMAEHVERDFSCLYIASFDPAGFQQDRALRILVDSTRDDVSIRSRGRLVVQSESARRTSRLINAFASQPGSPESPGIIDGADELLEVRSNIVPTGYHQGDFTALLQISVPPAPMQGATWDLGASIILGEKVDKEASGRLSVPVPGIPVVFEKELSFRPGSYEVISVAHEATTGMISSSQSDIEWPDPRKRAATMSSVAVLQPVTGAFLRGEETRTSGSLARGFDQPVRTDLPTALVSLVCRGRKFKKQLTVERTLLGSSEVDFPPIVAELSDEPCAQVRDLVRARTLGEGYYRYRITVLSDGEVLEETDREFFAVDPR